MKLFIFIVGICITYSYNLSEAALTDSILNFSESNDTQLMNKILLSETDNNVIYSPISANLILALLAEASDQNSSSYKELITLLPENYRWQHLENFQRFVQKIKNDESQQIILDTKIFSKQPKLIDLHYKKNIRTYFNTSVEQLNDSSATTINKWIENVTKSNLKDFVSDNEIAYANLIFLNVIFFEGKWLNKFTFTEKDRFLLQNKNTIEVDFMKQTSSFSCYFGEDLESLQLPYDGGKYNMIILKPRTGDNLEELITKLNPNMIHKLQQKMRVEIIEVSMPKFKFSSKIDLKKILISLNKTSLFSEDARLTKLGNQIRITTISQKAGIAIDERGTTAYAATNVMESRSIRREFYVGSPFLFLILETETHDIIFAGKVINPKLSN